MSRAPARDFCDRKLRYAASRHSYRWCSPGHQIYGTPDEDQIPFCSQVWLADITLDILDHQAQRVIFREVELLPFELGHDLAASSRFESVFQPISIDLGSPAS